MDTETKFDQEPETMDPEGADLQQYSMMEENSLASEEQVSAATETSLVPIGGGMSEELDSADETEFSQEDEYGSDLDGDQLTCEESCIESEEQEEEEDEDCLGSCGSNSSDTPLTWPEYRQQQVAAASQTGLPVYPSLLHALPPRPQPPMTYPYNYPSIFVTDISPSELLEAAARQQPFDTVGTVQQLPYHVVAQTMAHTYNPPPWPASSPPVSPDSSVEELPPVRHCPVHSRRRPMPLPQRCTIPGKKIMVVVEGLDMQVFTASRLFNLFCIYGNIMSIKLLNNPRGKAVVEVDCEEVSARCVKYLDGLEAFSGTLKLSQTTREEAPNCTEPFITNDGVKSIVDCSKIKVNRFTTPERAVRNACGKPSKTLFGYNIPNSILPEKIKVVFERHCPTNPELKVVDLRPLMRRAEILDQSTRKFYCVLVTLENVKAATVALIALNNATVRLRDGTAMTHMRLRYAADTREEMLALRSNPPLPYLFMHDHGDDEHDYY